MFFVEVNAKEMFGQRWFVHNFGHHIDGVLAALQKELENVDISTDPQDVGLPGDAGARFATDVQISCPAS